jgi:ribonuclease P protein component
MTTYAPVDASFPRAARLLKAAQFSAIFRSRPLRRSAHFVVYMLSSSAATAAGNARLGVVIGRKCARRAATRNLVRRVTREAFRMRREELAGWDVLLRMHRAFEASVFPSAASVALKRACREEIIALLDLAVKQVAERRAAAAAAPPVASGGPDERASP